jgi:uncharacterized membrane protein
LEAAVNKPKEKVKIEFVFCHRKPERSFFYKGKQFPVCARCTGFYFGYFALPIFTFGIWEPTFLWIGLLMLPALVDGLTQAYMNRESNNWLRLATGLPAGAGCMALAALTGQWIGHMILWIAA